MNIANILVNITQKGITICLPYYIISSPSVLATLQEFWCDPVRQFKSPHTKVYEVYTDKAFGLSTQAPEF